MSDDKFDPVFANTERVKLDVKELIDHAASREIGSTLLVELMSFGVSYFDIPKAEENDGLRQEQALHALATIAKFLEEWQSRSGHAIASPALALFNELAMAIVSCATHSPNSDNPRPHRLLTYGQLFSNRDVILPQKRSINKSLGGATAKAFAQAHVQNGDSIVAEAFGVQRATVNKWRNSESVSPGTENEVVKDVLKRVENGQSVRAIAEHYFKLGAIQSLGLR